MKYAAIIFSLIGAFSGFAQGGEEIGPLTGNPSLMAKSVNNQSAFKANGTFDSTFIYTSDTLQSLPVFDDFSSDKFQVFEADFNDPGVTSILEYRLLELNSTPVPSDFLGTALGTFKRRYNEETASFTDIPHIPVEIQLGDLSSYPPAYQTVFAYPPFNIYDTIQFTGGVDLDPDTVWVVGAELYQDSARQFFATVSDPTAIWIDKEAYRNYSMAKDPWSLGFVTFDGLDETGYPYAINTTLTNYADHLTSKPINMQGLNASDSVYFSFMYQAQGLADAPEQGDSLILQFYSSSLDQWNHVWSTNGIALDTFRAGHILVDNPIYLTDAFQFRFVNYGGLSGSLDHFHVDYVNLRSVPGFGGSGDTLLRDIAFSYPVGSLLEEFTSVPWDHYKSVANPASKMSDQVRVVMANSFPTQISANDGNSEIYYNGSLEGSFTMVSDILCNNVNDNYFALDIPYSSHDVDGYFYDQSKPGLSQTFEIRSVATGGSTNFFGNDSTVSTQVFSNYYSYDDGSAEAAYGTTGAQSRLAIQYTPYEADSLIGAMIHFVPSVVDVSNKLFLLTVWDDNNGVPGNVLYEDNLFFPRSPEYKYTGDLFKNYFFEDTMKIPVTGTFYIGWRQFDPERLNVGLDRNLVNNDHTFYSVDGGSTWDQSSFEGSVMIRPIFSTGLDVTLGIKETSLEEASVIYPNPTTGIVNIKSVREFNGAILRNMQGQIILQTQETQFTMEDLPSGIYFLEIEGERKLHKISKI